MYTFKPLDSSDKNIMFPFSKTQIEDYRWAMLPPASKAVYPILCCYRNKEGIAFPDESTIGCLANLTEKTVRGGLKALADDGWIKAKSYVTQYGNRAYKYFIPEVKTVRGTWFPFHNNILTSGVWYMASPTAKALYPVLRCYTEFDYEDSLLVEDDFTEYSKRQWEFCRQSERTKEILELAGICYNSFKPALSSLQEVGLIEQCGEDDSLKIFLRPPKYYLREYLNNKNKKLFGWKLRRRNNKTLSRLHLPDPGLVNKVAKEECIDIFAED